MTTPPLRRMLDGIRSHPSVSLLLLLTIIGAALRIYHFSGILGTDDLRHAWGGRFFWENLHRPFLQYFGYITSLRVGMDFLLWICFSVFGVHEWSAGLVPLSFSLAGIWAIYLLARRVAGEPAGLTAAGVQTFLPADIYQAGVWLQDVVLATLIVTSVIWLIRSLEAESRRAVAAWGLSSGAILGFAFYVKEITPMVLGGYVLWALPAATRDRRALRVGWVVVGFIAFMGLGALYWYHVAGDPLFNMRRMAEIQLKVMQREVPLSYMLMTFPGVLLLHSPFGLTLLFTPVFLLVFALAPSIRYRWLILSLLALLCYSLVRVAQMGVQQRYLLLIAPPVVVVASAAISVLSRRLSRPMGYALMTSAVLLTALGLVNCRPQWGWQGLAPLRAVHTILALTDTPGDPVFADPRTILILYQMNGFEPYRGGLYRYPARLPSPLTRTWDDAYRRAFSPRYGVSPDLATLTELQRGWVVHFSRLADRFDARYGPVMPAALKHPPRNWIRIVEYQDPRGGFVSLYLVRPRDRAPR